MTRGKDTHNIPVLLVEDNVGDVKLVQLLFEESTSPIALEVVTNGVEAIDYLERKKPYESATVPRLVILDLKLPIKDGIAVLEQMKSDAALRHIPVVVLSASTAEEDVAQCFAHYASSYIVKPAKLEELTSVIQCIDAYWLRTVRLPK